MSTTCILRFRDLVTEEGGTIAEHKQLISLRGDAWWGWWMRQYESAPLTYLKEISQKIEVEGDLKIYLFNTGRALLFSASLRNILAAPAGHKIATPDASRTPEYYQRGKYPAWFLLSGLEEVSWHSREFYYESFPTRPERSDWTQLLGQRVSSLEQLRQIDVTLWSVDDRSEVR